MINIPRKGRAVDSLCAVCHGPVCMSGDLTSRTKRNIDAAKKKDAWEFISETAAYSVNVSVQFNLLWYYFGCKQ